MSDNFILILDFGGPNARKMARRLRANGYYCELQPHTVEPAIIEKKDPNGLIFAGDCLEVSFNEALLASDRPKLALGSSARRIMAIVGAKRKSIQLANRAAQIQFLPCPLFEDLSESNHYFERIDDYELPEGTEPIAWADQGVCAGYHTARMDLYGLQFYPETNDPDGTQILMNFAANICRCAQTWSPDTYIKNETEFLKARIGEKNCIAAITGSIESAVCAALLKKAFGGQVRFITVDTGCLTKNEAESIRNEYLEHLNIDVEIVDCSRQVISQISGISSAREKRTIIENAVHTSIADAVKSMPDVSFILFATTYTSLLEYPEQLTTLGRHFDGVECLYPLRMLFYDEIREIAASIQLPDIFIDRQPFPMAGLAAYCVGPVTESKLEMLREADHILHMEMQESGYQKKRLQYYPVLTNMCSPSQNAAHSTPEYTCILRVYQAYSTDSTESPARLPYDLLARLVEQIVRQVPGINHVLYDITAGTGDVFEPEEPTRGA